MKKEYINIKDYFNNLNSEQKTEILYDLKQLKGLVLDEIEIPHMKQYLINNIIMVLNYFDSLLAKDWTEKELQNLQLLIKDDIVSIKESDEIIYGEKRTFGEYMNYIYNVIEFILSRK